MKLEFFKNNYKLNDMKTFNVLCYFKDSKALQIDFREFAKLRYFKGFKNFNDLKELIYFLYFKYTLDFKSLWKFIG